MGERNINLDTYDPLEIFGPNNINLELMSKIFPKIKIISRGNMVKLMGEDDEILEFEKKFLHILNHYDRFGIINQPDIIRLLEDDVHKIKDKNEYSDEILVHGKNGMLIKARTPNQRKMVESYNYNDLIFAIGPAGTGKTYTAVALAVRALKNKEVKRIILTRPAVEAGENLGFLPGDFKDKLDPYLQPLYDALRDMIPPAKLSTLMEDGTIEIAPLAYMRGRTLDNAFAILDEAQNATKSQLKMFLTRMGKAGKFFVTGDITQVDLPKRHSSGLVHAAEILKGIKGIDFIFLNDKDIIRHSLVIKIVEAYQKDENFIKPKEKDLL